MFAVGVDIGGTKIAAGVVDDNGTILAKVKRPTEPLRPESIDEAIADAVLELAREHEIDAVGLAAAGFVSADRATVTFAPNIAWRDYPLGPNVARLIGLDVPLVVENDANAAGWAEFVHGAGREARSMALLTVGTGLGGAIVTDGALVRGAYGFAAEVGHIRVVPDGHACGCGHNGCWEQYSSGSALVREARNAAVQHPARAQRLLDAAGGDAAKIKGPLVTQLAKEGDDLSIALLRELGEWIGRGCAGLASILDPEIFIVGGGVIDAGELILAPAQDAYRESLPALDVRPVAPIVAAHLRNDAGIVGAAALAREAGPAGG
jgi:glucokinase